MPYTSANFSWYRFVVRLVKAGFWMVVILISVFYLSAPYFQFPKPAAFAGKHFYNPYADSMLPQAKHISFRMNALHLADVLLNGRVRLHIKHADTLPQPPFELDISNFQYRHRYLDRNNELLTIYRHGYGLTNDQQLCVGAEKVIWTEYPFVQQLRHKQDVLWKLSRSAKVVALTDPARSYTDEQLQLLSGYQLMELTNTEAASLHAWDVALSHGHYIHLLLTNLDKQGLNLEEEILFSNQMLMNEINAGTLTKALLDGRFFNLSRPASVSETPAPELISVKVNNDTLTVKTMPEATSITYIGQNGKVLLHHDKLPAAGYPLKEDDSYVRVQLSFADGSTIYLNPIARSSNAGLPEQPAAVFDSVQTALMRAAFTILIVFFLALFIHYSGRKAKR